MYRPAFVTATADGSRSRSGIARNTVVPELGDAAVEAFGDITSANE
jgi:hypothetical protein